MDCGIQPNGRNNPRYCNDIIDIFKLPEEEREKQWKQFQEDLKRMIEREEQNSNQDKN